MLTHGPCHFPCSWLEWTCQIYWNCCYALFLHCQKPSFKKNHKIKNLHTLTFNKLKNTWWVRTKKNKKMTYLKCWCKIKTTMQERDSFKPSQGNVCSFYTQVVTASGWRPHLIQPYNFFETLWKYDYLMIPFEKPAGSH